jgi:RNA polymerase sigma factor (sigma-70 family)
MTLNVARHLWRARGRTSKREVLWMSECPPNAPASPSDELEMRRAVQRLEKAVSALPEAYRIVYFLCEVQGLPSPEIAAMTGLSPDTLRVRRFRARQQVAKLLSFEAS